STGLQKLRRDVRLKYRHLAYTAHRPVRVLAGDQHLAAAGRRQQILYLGQAGRVVENEQPFSWMRAQRRVDLRDRATGIQHATQAELRRQLAEPGSKR